MNCSEVQERLSAYHDSELSPDEAAHVSAHVEECSSCAAALASFERLSALSRRLTDPLVPGHIWEELQPKLATRPESRTLLTWFLPHHENIKYFALAATIFIAIGIGVVSYFNWFSHSDHDHHLAMNFSRYLEELSEQPDKAQQILLAEYDGRHTTWQEATHILGYEPIAARGLPADYILDKVYLLNMPCCTCAQAICKNREGQSIAIFEHAIDQPIWFGDKPTVDCLCHDTPTSVTQIGDRLAASWKEGPRYITIIGATDLDEVTEFVAHFKGNNPAKS